MGLIRRNKSVPVQVQRSDGTREQEIVDIPRGVRVPSTQASGQPNVTQNNIYISTPAAQASAPPLAPPPPTEIHHHTTVHHISRVMERRRGLSFFGVAGLVLGGLAWAAIYTPSAGVFIRPLALAGLASAGFGLLIAILFGQSGRGVPVLALLVAGAAYGMWFYNNGGRLQPEVAKAKALIEQGIGQGEKSLPSPVVTSGQAAPAPAPPMDLETAKEAAAKRMGLDYKSAKTAADAAKAELIRDRDVDAPGSAALVVAAQSSVAADSRLNEIEAKLRSDPAVVAAENVGKK
jgi:hypothetical protein